MEDAALAPMPPCCLVFTHLAPCTPRRHQAADKPGFLGHLLLGLCPVPLVSDAVVFLMGLGWAATHTQSLRCNNYSSVGMDCVVFLAALIDWPTILLQVGAGLLFGLGIDEVLVCPGPLIVSVRFAVVSRQRQRKRRRVQKKKKIN